MYPRRKRAAVRRTELQLEWLEDRQLLSGGTSVPLLQSLLSSTGASALVGAVRLTPLDVAAPGSPATVNVKVGLGSVINLTGNGIVNPGSFPIANVQVDTGGIFDSGMEFNYGLDDGIGIAFGGLGPSSPGENSFPPSQSLAESAVLDLLLNGPSNAGPDVSRPDFKGTIGDAGSAPPSSSEVIDRSGPTGEDNESFAPRTDDLQDSRSANAGSLSVLFQRVFDNIGDLGRDSLTWISGVGWRSWLAGLVIAATVGMVLRRKFRRAPGDEVLPTKATGSLESWWFSSLK